ncbi:Bug family tripartite tricarboxylate transporter substrate binding protein [Lacisediminimonas profundi]|uniref:Bug family tripartite tricarboxylate transporter substrate binding protein n=1 Tax=Lacisediminimonas profundi TaxID=2603856 RepID=UPI00124B8613|nr:tripartite tricarboxylate transporter substrate binding protein [Lacisediminimonas profundi]
MHYCFKGLKAFTRSIALLALAATAGHAVAQSQAVSAYPDKPVKIVAPFTPGGALDFIARSVATRLNAQLNQSFVVENRPGAAGIIGTQAVMRSPADGYTLLLGATTTHGINPTLYKTKPYDAVKDFEPVSLIATIPHVLIVHPSTPANNLQEFIRYAKSKPGLAFGSAGIGSPHHLAGEMLKSRVGIDVIHAPYKGSGAAMTDLMGGQIGFMSIEYTAAATNIKAGKLKAIAIASDKRIPGLDVPTYAEQGMNGFEVTAWYALFAPAKTPQAIVDKLAKEVNVAVNFPQFRESLMSLGATPIGSSSAQLGSFVKKDLEQWAKVIASSGATAE